MANDKKFIVKNGLLTQENVVIGSTTDTGEKLQVTGTTKATGQVEITQATASPSLTVKNTNNTLYDQFIEFEGRTSSLVLRDIGDGDYGWYNTSGATEIKFNNNAGNGLEFFVGNNSKLQLTTTQADFKVDPTVNGSTIWYANNDGTGSGLDADLLDGVEGASFVRSDEDDTMSGSYVITGNLTVQGTTTTVNSETVLIADNLLTLNSNYTGSTPTENAGWEVERGTLNNSSLQWDETNDWFKLISAGTDLGRIITTADEGSGNGFDADTVDGLEAEQFLRADADDTATGNITIEQVLTIGDNSGPARINFDGNGTNRSIYGTAGNIGFTNNSLSWSAYSDTNDDWIVTANTVAQSFVDADDASYYLIPGGDSVLNNIGIDQKIFHNGDVDTFMNFGENTISFDTGGATRFSLSNSDAEFTLPVYAPIYYDRDAVTYYMHPGDDSVLHSIGLDDWIFHNGDATARFGFPNNGEFHVDIAGVNRLSIDNNSADFSVDVYAPKFIDSNNNTYFLDPGATSGPSLVVSQQIQGDDGTAGIPGYGFEAGTSTGMYRSSADVLAFTQGGVNRFFVGYSGGAANWSLLDMRAPRFVDSDNTAYYADPASDSQMNTIDIDDYIRHRGDITTYVGFPTNGQISTFTNGAERMRTTDTLTYFDQNVSIGTTSNAYTLDVYHATLDTIARFKSGDNRASIAVSDDDTTAYVLAENSLAHFGMTSFIDEANLVINADGNVGIGTVTPNEANLNLSTRSAATNNPFASGNKLLSLQDNDTEKSYWALDNSSNVWIIGNGEYLFSTTGANIGVTIDAGNGELVIGDQNGTYATMDGTYEGVSIAASPSPSANKLHVNGSVQLNSQTDVFAISAADGGNANINAATFLGVNELGFSAGGGFFMDDTTTIKIRGNKNILTTGDMYAGRFYDDDNNNYYVDPAGDSQLNTIDIDDYIRHRGDTNTYIGFEADDTFRIWTNGTQRFNIDNNSADFAVNVYAPIYFDSDNNTYYGNFGNTDVSIKMAGEILGGDGALATPTYAFNSQANSGMYKYATNVLGFAANGNDEFRVYSDHTLSVGSSRAPIFYDSDNTAYYTNPASTSYLYNAYIKGGHDDTRLQLWYPSATAANEAFLTLWASEPGLTYHGAGIGANIDFNGQYYGRETAGQPYGVYLSFRPDTGQASIQTTTGAPDVAGAAQVKHFYVNPDGNVYSRVSHRAPIFYDSNNTAYYTDQASTSLHNVQRVQQLQVDSSTYTIDGVTGDYGSIKVSGYTNAYAGYAINDDWVFMANGSSSMGLYNDTRNEWVLEATDNSWTRLYANGVHQIGAENGYGYAPNQMRAPYFVDSDNTSFYANFAAGNTATAISVNGQISRTGFATGDVTTNKYLVAEDNNHWIWTPTNNWGIFWATTTSSLAHFGSANPNEITFIGNGDIKASIDLDNGNFYAKGEGTFSNIRISGGNEDLPLLKSYGSGLADTVLFDGTMYWEKRVIQAMQGTEDSATTNTADFVKSGIAPVASSYIIRTNGYRTFVSDYIEVEPGEELYGEIAARYVSGSGSTLYFGIERFDKNKVPIAANTGTTYFVASNVNVSSTSWTTYSGHTTIPTNHTPFSGSDGEGVKYVRIRLLMNYQTNGALREFGPPILKRTQVHSRLRSSNIYAPIFYDSDDNNYYLDPASTSKLNQVDASNFRDRDNTAYFMNPATGGKVTGSWDWTNGSIINLNNLSFNDPGPQEGIHWKSGNEWKIYESPNDLTTNAGGNLQFTSGTGAGTMRMRVESDGDVFAGNNMYAAAFIDTNNTSFSANPAGTSVFSKLHIGSTSNLGDGTDPDISTSIIQATSKVVTPKVVFLNDGTGDDNYIQHSDTNSAHTAAGQQMGAWFEFVGDKISATSTNSAGIVASGLKSRYGQFQNRLDAAIMYDYDSTSYYVDPASTSRLNTLRTNRLYPNYDNNSSVYFDYPTSYGTYGSVGIFGSGKGGYEGYSIDNRYVFMSSSITNVGIYNDYDNEWMLYGIRNAGVDLYYNGSVQLETENGFGYARNQMRSPIFYDSNDTSYYGNFASTSRFNVVNLNTLQFNGLTFTNPEVGIWYEYPANRNSSGSYSAYYTRLGEVSGLDKTTIIEYYFTNSWSLSRTIAGKIIVTRDGTANGGGGTIGVAHLPTEINSYMSSSDSTNNQPELYMDQDRNLWIRSPQGDDLDAKLYFRYVQNNGGINENFAFGNHFQAAATARTNGTVISNSGGAALGPGVKWTFNADTPHSSYSGGPFRLGGNHYHNANRFYAEEGFYSMSNDSYKINPQGASQISSMEMDSTLKMEGGAEIQLETSSSAIRGYIQATETNDAHLIIATSGGEDISFRDGGLSGQWNMIIRGDGDVLTNRNHYAQAFYDRNDSARYLNPNGTSELGTVRADRFDMRDRGDFITFYGDDSTNHGIASRDNAGTASDDIRINTYGSLFINLDSNENNSSAADFRIGRHGGSTSDIDQLGLFDVYGDSLYAYSAYSFRSPIFYDSNDTGYYTNPASTSIMNSLDIRGEVYNDGWFRNDTGGKGLYSTAHAMHWYATDDNYWDLSHNDDNASIGIRLRGTYDGTIRGYLYAESDNDFGLLGSQGSWRLRVVAGDWIDVAGGSVRAKIFYDRDNTGYYFDGASTSRSNYHRINNLYDSQERRYTAPNGGTYTTTTSSVTGAIRIRMPTNRFKSNTMMKFKVSVYEYSEGRTHEFLISGYNNNNANQQWYNVAATQLTDDNRSAYTIRWGGNGTDNIVWIGNTNSTWSYPQVHVQWVDLGYSGFSTNWGQDWIIDFVTSFDTVTVTRTASLVYTLNNKDNWAYDLRGTLFYDNNNTGYYCDPASTSNFNSVLANRLRLDDGGVNGHLYTGDTYLDIAYGANGGGGIRLYDNQDVLQGYWYGNGGGEHGFLDNDGNWAVRVRTGTSSMLFYTDDNNEFQIHTSYTYSPGSSRAPIFYDSDDTGYYTNPAATSNMLNISGLDRLTFLSGPYIDDAGNDNRLNFYCSDGDNGSFYFTESGGQGGRIYVDDDGSIMSLYHDNGEAVIYADQDYITYLYYNGTWEGRTRSGYFEARGSFRGPLFYDSNNTFYYTNPASTSRMNAISAYGEIRSDENIIAYYDYSDIRWKENVKIIDNAVDKVKQLDGITYNYIDREGEYTGVIAQQVEKVLPGVVYDTEDMKTGKERKGVRYGNMVGLLIEATKEQQETIEKQQEEIDKLKEMVYNLMEKLDK